MDLAKIRKKSLLSHTQAPLASSQHTPTNVAIVPAQETASVLNNRQAFITISGGIAPFSAAASQPEREAAVHTPLEIILAGRTASGCDDESTRADEEIVPVVSNHLEFLCFRVSDEIYGINILDIKEIIKSREVTEVPRTPAFVSGILSLRGTIIPIIDMRERLGLLRVEKTGKERVVVIRCSDAFSGLLVDEIIQVMRVPFEGVEPAPAVLVGIDRNFVRGIGRSDGRLIIILNLESITDIHLY